MNKKIILYVVVGVVVLGLLLFTIFPGMIYAVKDSGITGNSVSAGDKCSPPAGSGYTEESWREHMSHHPNIYAECLEESNIKDLNPEGFESLISSEEVFVINTHTPYIGEIGGTDLIAENWQDIRTYSEQLPKGKNTPVAVYCRSGSMSADAARQLSELGYKNIYNLEGGMNAWKASGRELKGGN